MRSYITIALVGATCVFASQPSEITEEQAVLVGFVYPDMDIAAQWESLTEEAKVEIKESVYQMIQDGETSDNISLAQIDADCIYCGCGKPDGHNKCYSENTSLAQTGAECIHSGCGKTCGHGHGLGSRLYRDYDNDYDYGYGRDYGYGHGCGGSCGCGHYPSYSRSTRVYTSGCGDNYLPSSYGSCGSRRNYCY